ncbi:MULTISPECIES: hypothetical protein [Sulfurimonas]|uniref:hypothetical protein n=1 Tax=Sulfurimonas TaxID=202746 RepID=UPI00126555CB|nr:hypothetical protein [Sulfurimonas indica]
MKKILLSGLVTMLLGASLVADNVSSYEYASFKSVNDVKSALHDNGLKVIGEYDVMGDPSYHVIAYTCPTLTNDASKEDRAFAAVQKVLVNSSDNELVLTNPEYFLHAFMQDDFKEEHAKKVNAKLANAFGTLKGSQDGLDDDDIAGYHFMMGMPYYEDMIEVAKGDNLVQKLEKNAADNIAFKIQAGKATLYGIAMPTEKGEKYYVPEIKGQKHTAFLPYMVMIEGDEAKILHPKYYLAISYPNLSMGNFMSISGTPGDIEEYMAGLFK